NNLRFRLIGRALYWRRMETAPSQLSKWLRSFHFIALVFMRQGVRFWDWVRSANSIFIAGAGRSPGHHISEIGFVSSTSFGPAVTARIGCESSSRSIMNLESTPL